jgi:hypothetical protein
MVTVPVPFSIASVVSVSATTSRPARHSRSLAGAIGEVFVDRAREGVTGNQHLARLSCCKRAHSGCFQRLDLSGPRHARDSGLPRPSSIASTVRYTALAPDRFKGFWRD